MAGSTGSTGSTSDTGGSRTARTPKGDRRREQLARAAADLVREEGPAALGHRAVAARAGLSLSATTYYYSGLDALAAAAGTALVAEWVAHAESVRARVRAGGDGPAGGTDPAAVVVEAVLPPGDDAAVLAHYEQLLAAGRVPALAAALGAGRARLDAVVAALLHDLLPHPPRDLAPGATPGPAAALVLAVVDGAVVSAVSEGRPVRATARDLLAAVLPAVPRPATGTGDAVR
jgi:DNA-binding transcriptional regulator YbjK